MGAAQLVVHDAFDSMSLLFFKISSFTPNTIVSTSPLAGA